MPAQSSKKEEVRQMRIEDVPLDIHRRVLAHQKLLSVKKQKEVTLDEASIDLLRIAVESIPALNP